MHQSVGWNVLSGVSNDAFFFIVPDQVLSFKFRRSTNLMYFKNIIRWIFKLQKVDGTPNEHFLNFTASKIRSSDFM